MKNLNELFIIGAILKYFRQTKHYPTWRFILELTIVCFLLKVLFGIIFGIILTSIGVNIETDMSFESELVKSGFLLLILATTIFAAFETFVGQLLIIWLVGKFTKNTYIKIFVSAIIFALLHVEPVLILAVFPIGIILAWAFLLYWRKSLWSAIWVTTAIHVLHNLIASWFIWQSL